MGNQSIIHSQSQRDLVRSIYIYNRSGIDQLIMINKYWLLLKEVCISKLGVQ